MLRSGAILIKAEEVAGIIPRSFSVLFLPEEQPFYVLTPTFSQQTSPQQRRRALELSLGNAFWLMLIDVVAGALFMLVAWTSADCLQEISASDYEDLWRGPLGLGVIFLMNQVLLLSSNFLAHESINLHERSLAE